MKNQSVPKLPQAALCHKTPPDVRHPEGTVTREIEQWEGLPPPPGGLAVERTPGSGRKPCTRRPLKLKRTVQGQTPDCIDIGREIRQTLLYRCVDNLLL